MAKTGARNRSIPRGQVIRQGNYMVLKLIFQRLRETNKKELARRIGVSESFIHHIKSGRRGPGLATVRRLADALGFPLEDVVRYCDKVARRYKRVHGKHKK